MRDLPTDIIPPYSYGEWKQAKPRKDQVCRVCNKKIPKGTIAFWAPQKIMTNTGWMPWGRMYRCAECHAQFTNKEGS